MASQKFIDTALSIHLLFILDLYSDTDQLQSIIKNTPVNMSNILFAGLDILTNY